MAAGVLRPAGAARSKGLGCCPTSPCKARGFVHTKTLLASVHQVHGVGLAVLLVSVLGFVEHGGMLIFEQTRGVVNFNETPNQVLNALENVVVALAEALSDLAAGFSATTITLNRGSGFEHGHF